MIDIEITNTTSYTPPRKQISQAAKAAAQELGLKRKYSISFAVVDDKEMARLNHTYRRKNKVTDVLSFEHKENKGTDASYGEIIVAYPFMNKKARKLHLTTDQECISLFVHGLMHVFSYDHKKPADAAQMFQFEKNILNHLI